MFDQVSPIEIPRSSVMRFDSSTEISHSVAAGTSPVFDHWTVGSDISSATQGSSVASVAGKKRAPTKQCAKASAAESATKRSANANARQQLEERSMNNLHWRLGRWRPPGGRQPSQHRGRASRAMSIGFGAVEADQTHRQIEPFDRELRRAGCGNGPWKRARKLRHAADAGFEA